MNKNKLCDDDLCKFVGSNENKTINNKYDNCSYKENVMYKMMIQHKNLREICTGICIIKIEIEQSIILEFHLQ